MGISGLLPLLKDISINKSINEYNGKTAAIDGYSWLHKGAYSCAQELCLGQPTDKYIKFFYNRLMLLKHANIKPYVVFDGGRLIAKSNKEKERHNLRKENLEKGKKYLLQGKKTLARECFTRAVDITPSIAYNVIKRLKDDGIDYIVAPYEADAQLSYLSRNKIVDFIISEDSDLLVYQCNVVFFKMDQYGNGQEICLQNLNLVKTLDFVTFDNDMFMDMCILSGCDYLASLPGIGIRKSYALIKKYKDYRKAIKSIQFDGKIIVPDDYIKQFELARLTYRHQVVYDPNTQEMCHLTTLRDVSLDDIEFLGNVTDNDKATKIASGVIDPITGLYFSGSELKEIRNQLTQVETEPKNAFNILMGSNSSSITPVYHTKKRKHKTLHFKQKILSPIKADIISKKMCTIPSNSAKNGQENHKSKEIKMHNVNTEMFEKFRYTAVYSKHLTKSKITRPMYKPINLYFLGDRTILISCRQHSDA